MSSYDEPKVQHKSTVQQIIDARQRALTAVSEVRQVQINTPHPNLARMSGDGKQLPVLATQAVVDYLLQLRPYRKSSQNWDVDFGTIDLPKTVSSDIPGRGRGSQQLYICRQPKVPATNASQLIQALNSDVHYSTNHPNSSTTTTGNNTVQARQTGAKVTTVTYRISPDTYPGTYQVSQETAKRIRQGQITEAEAVEKGMIVDNQDDKTEEYTPAIPEVRNNGAGDISGPNGEVRSYKLVVGPDALLQLVELADEIAAEVDMLAELEDKTVGDTSGL
jgi:hypothetical protein